MRVFLSILAAACSLLAAASLASGAAWLSITISQAFPLPLGQIVAAVLYVSLTSLTVLATRAGTLLRRIAWVLFAAGVLWLPVSIWLTGNLNLDFTGSSWRGKAWILYTVAVLPGGSVLLLLAELIRRVFHRFRRKAEPNVAPVAPGERH